MYVKEKKKKKKYILRFLHGFLLQEKHGIGMDFEPMTATPLIAHKRLQFNMFLHKVEKFKLMKNFPECLFPFFWVEEGIELGGEFLAKLKMVFKMISVIG